MSALVSNRSLGSLSSELPADRRTEKRLKKKNTRDRGPRYRARAAASGSKCASPSSTLAPDERAREFTQVSDDGASAQKSRTAASADTTTRRVFFVVVSRRRSRATAAAAAARFVSVETMSAGGGCTPILRPKAGRRPGGAVPRFIRRNQAASYDFDHARWRRWRRCSGDATRVPIATFVAFDF